MKKIIITVLAFTAITFANTNNEHNSKATANNLTNIQTVCTIDTTKILEIERSGCCSWHGGVDGCDYNGRVVCNDGSLSPSCTCAVPTSQTI